mgnify:CR=1 FL=1
MPSLRRPHRTRASATVTGRIFSIRRVVGVSLPFTHCARADAPRTVFQGLCNICDYPSAVFPVTAVDPALDVKGEPHAFASAFDKLNYERYDPEVYRDAPVALQVYARKGEDEATIRFAEICAAALEASR